MQISYMLFQKLLAGALLLALGIVHNPMGSPVTSTTAPALPKRTQGIDINISIPAFLIRIPFHIQSGPNEVQGFIKIYYKFSRSIKFVNNGPFQRYLARISTTTFIFMFEYESGSQWFGQSQHHYTKDILYLNKVSAQFQSVSSTGLLTING